MRADAIILGGGHAGLTMSRCLSDRGVDHLILERGTVAHSWKTQRWDSLRLLTPNWQNQLPGLAYEGDDPDGFMTMAEVVAFVERYAQVAVSAPIHDHTAVRSVRRTDAGYALDTDRGPFACRALVLATGACNRAHVPKIAEALPPGLTSVTSLAYRNPDQLPAGGVLVVGASATGVQLADELQRSGRPVTLAVGEHVRLPRTYRGRDIQWWMDRSGVLDMDLDEVDDLGRARRVPSPQLVGTPERITLDLNALTEQGVRLVGRLAGCRDGRAQFSGSLRNVCSLADLKMNRLLGLADEWAEETGVADEVEPVHRFERTRVEASPPLSLDLRAGEISTVVWATGYLPDYSWLDVPVLDRKGRIRHEGGVVDSPGLYLLGLPFLRRRKSSFIHGAGDDARELSDHLATYLDTRARP